MRQNKVANNTIFSAFEEAIEEQSGRVLETVESGSHLFVRSVLPLVAEARPGDQMQGGVALHATDSDICVHPYLFREVCRNGAILANCIGSWHVEFSEFAEEYSVIQSLKDAVALCSQSDVFHDAMSNVRASVNVQVDTMLSMVTLLNSLGGLPQEVLSLVLDAYSADPSNTRFAVMNAVTSVARDTPEPHSRWRLEELGGSIGAKLLPQPSTGGTGRHYEIGDPVEIG